MAVGDIVPVPGVPFEDTLASASPDLLREMIKEFARRMMDAEVESLCGAAYGEVSPDRVNSRNGYRRREWDTAASASRSSSPTSRSCVTVSRTMPCYGAISMLTREGPAAAPGPRQAGDRVQRRGCRRRGWPR